MTSDERQPPIRPTPRQPEGCCGVIVFGLSSVGLAIIAVSFKNYPSLSFADVDAVIGYDLRHGDEVDAYLAAQQQEADLIRQQNEARFNPASSSNAPASRRSSHHAPPSPRCHRHGLQCTRTGDEGFTRVYQVRQCRSISR